MITKFFSLRRDYRILFLKWSGPLLLLLKAMCHLCAKFVWAAAWKNVLNDIVTAHKKTFSTLEKRKWECRKSRIHSEYAVRDLITMLQNNAVRQQLWPTHGSPFVVCMALEMIWRYSCSTQTTRLIFSLWTALAFQRRVMYCWLSVYHTAGPIVRIFE